MHLYKETLAEQQPTDAVMGLAYEHIVIQNINDAHQYFNAMRCRAIIKSTKKNLYFCTTDRISVYQYIASN